MRKNCAQIPVRIYAEMTLTNFRKDLCGKKCGQNSVRIHAEIMSTTFSKDLCGNNVDNIQ